MLPDKPAKHQGYPIRDGMAACIGMVYNVMGYSVDGEELGAMELCRQGHGHLIERLIHNGAQKVTVLDRT